VKKCNKREPLKRGKKKEGKRYSIVANEASYGSRMTLAQYRN